MSTINNAINNRQGDPADRHHKHGILTAGLGVIVVLMAVAAALLVAIPAIFAHTAFGSVAGVSEADLIAGVSNADYDITFTVFSPNVTAHTTREITITFPAGYTLDNSEAAISAGTDGLGNPNKIEIDGSEASPTASASTSGQDFIVRLSNSIDLRGVVAFRITGGVDNPLVSGQTGTFSIGVDVPLGFVPVETGIAGVMITPGATLKLVRTAPEV